MFYSSRQAAVTRGVVIMKHLISILALSALLAAMGCERGSKDSTEVAEDQNERSLSNRVEDDADFAVDAADGGLLEVELGTLAGSKASSSEVKAFARMMVEDHGKANAQLTKIAQQKNIALPSRMSNEHQRKYERLREKSGQDFDKEYIDLMVEDHKDDIEDFEEQVREGNDQELKNWAEMNLPLLRQHLQEAERLKQALANQR